MHEQPFLFPIGFYADGVLTLLEWTSHLLLSLQVVRQLSYPGSLVKPSSSACVAGRAIITALAVSLLRFRFRFLRSARLLY